MIRTDNKCEPPHYSRPGYRNLEGESQTQPADQMLPYDRAISNSVKKITLLWALKPKTQIIPLAMDFFLAFYLLLFNKHVLGMLYVPGFLVGAVQRLKSQLYQLVSSH